jgi:Polyketide cyclase / dehydrase and lipid transport
MPQIQAFATVHRSAEALWREVGAFADIARWHPILTAEPSGEAERTIQTRDGHRWIERLTQSDPDQHLYRYEAASSELPINDFRGEFRIRGDAPNKCTVVWTAQFTVTAGNEKTVADEVRGFLCAGVRGIEDRYDVRPPAHNISTPKHPH